MKIKEIALFIITVFFAQALLVATSAAQQPELQISTKNEIAADVKTAPCRNADRLEAVRALFKKMGAADDDIAVEKYGSLSNLVVTRKGSTDDTVIVGAHYDKVSDGCRAIDNWTGITIIAHLFRTMKSTATNKTFKFVAFDGEESGLLGSAAMAKAIPKEKRSGFCSMINFDSFGFTYPRTFSEASTSKLIAAAKKLSADLKIPFAAVSIANADADSSSFLSHGIPAVTLDGLDDNWRNYLHSSKDKVENINIDSVFVGYNYALRFLATVDAVGCDEYWKK
jgi:Zn-dependent M28 family amino/carboxypeptidase